MTESTDRVEQVSWLNEIVANIGFGYLGKGTAEELVEYALKKTELPGWFDAHDRQLLVKAVAESIAE